jgi:hypothetical protein
MFEISATMDAPPHPEIYDALGDIPNRLIPPNQALGNIVSLTPNHYLTAQQVQAINNGDLFLWAYGFVAYRDTLGTDKEYLTRFCYCYIVPPLSQEAMFYLAGPNQYNDIT